MNAREDSAKDPKGATMLDSVRTFISGFVVAPSPAALDAMTLWTAHTHLIDELEDSPRLALISPEYGSGKSRALEILEILVPSPMLSLNASTAAIFRSLANGQRTLLFDEVDAIFGKRGKDDPSEDLRALLNAGYRRGATIPRCVGAAHGVVDFPVFAAVALASKGELPESVMSRSIIIRMRKRLTSETIRRFRRRIHTPEGHRIRDVLADWCLTLRGDVLSATPEMPEGVEDRSEDVWAPLIAIADAAGGHWPQTARSACGDLVKEALTREASLGVKLLGDIREVYGASISIPTELLLSRLRELEESPWGELHGKPLDATRLARLLRPYGVTSTKVKVAGKSVRGYRREDLWDPWARYLDPPSEAMEPTEPEEPTPPQSPSDVPEVP